jgi:hypothetical protein
MCNWQIKANDVFGRIGSGYVEDYFPPEFYRTFPPNRVQAGHCLVCQRPLSYQEMFSTGITPRYMDRYCYEKIAFCGPKLNCLTCGRPLPPEQVEEQKRSPRELSLALHRGPCDDYHSLLAGIVLGIPFKSRTFALPLKQAPFQIMPFGPLQPVHLGKKTRRVRFLPFPR